LNALAAPKPVFSLFVRHKWSSADGNRLVMLSNSEIAVGVAVNLGNGVFNILV
jgi:hypothetical protein